MFKTLSIFTLFLFNFTLLSYSQHFIDSNTVYLKGNASIFVKPGDTIFLLAGSKPYLLLENIHGTADSIIVIINKFGKVSINTNHYFGISTKNCTYFKISGTGTPNLTYGIDINGVTNGAGIGLSAMSNHYEIENIRIANTSLAGIYAKTDPDTNFLSTREKFHMSGIKIHDLWLENNQDEAMYIGSTKFFGQLISYKGKDTLVFPHLISDIEIYNNIIINSGWDGIQLSSASSNAKIYSNQIYGDSYRNYHNQMSGIMIGGGTKADCFNNYIANGSGTGIVVLGLGGQNIFNNIIINSGKTYQANDLTKMQHGIYVDDISTQIDSSFYIYNNLIINPKSDGIRFRSTKSKSNLINNNIIINPGNYGYYDTLNTSFKPKDAFIMLTDSQIDCDTSYNFFSLFYKYFEFTDTANYNFTLSYQSPCINNGKNLSAHNYDFDFYFHTRKTSNWDIGPFEFNSIYAYLPNKTDFQEINIFPNPCKGYLELQGDFREEILNYKIIDQTGKIVKNWHYGNGIIDTTNLLPGIYTIRITFKDKSSYNKKFIKIN